MARKQTFKRRPNKAGTVIKLSGKRRKPYCAKITTGKDIITGRQIQSVLGTFETWDEADDALTLYRLSQKNKITDIEAEALAPDTFQKLVDQREKNMPTFSELYNKVYEDYIIKLSNSSQRRYRACYKRLKEIHDFKINRLSLTVLQSVFDKYKDKVSKDSLSDTKILVKKVFEQAIITGAITKDENLTEYINISTNYKKTKIIHTPFTIDEINTLYKDNTFESKLILIYIFTGARPSELLNLSKDRFHIDEICKDDGEIKKVSYVIAGIKTEAGQDRIIPIHNVIKPFIKEILGNNDIFMPYTQKVPYEVYKRDIFYPTMKRLDMNHLPHDTRHTFGTLAELYKLDSYMVKKILGHKFQDLTKDVYTHVMVNKLNEEINKIKVL